jgi:hypothetical protein
MFARGIEASYRSSADSPTAFLGRASCPQSGFGPFQKWGLAQKIFNGLKEYMIWLLDLFVLLILK